MAMPNNMEPMDISSSQVNKVCSSAVGKFAGEVALSRRAQREQKDVPPLILSFKLDAMRLSRHM